MQPLQGVRVLDFSRLLPGPFASLVLADLGAQVDKVEDLEGGDYLRHMPPQIGDQPVQVAAVGLTRRPDPVDLRRPVSLGHRAGQLLRDLPEHRTGPQEVLRADVNERHRHRTFRPAKSPHSSRWRAGYS